MGPSVAGIENLTRAIMSGMNVARLNFSHGDHAGQGQMIRDIREVSRREKSPVAILQDLQGPKIRVGRFVGGAIDLVVGEEIKVVAYEGKPVDPSLRVVPVDFAALILKVSKGDKLLFDDGLIEVRVKDRAADHLTAEVVYGGKLKDRKGMNVPGSHLPIEALTEKDLLDLDFGITQGVDVVALSFVRYGKDIRKLRELLDRRNAQIKICAKIEMLEALDHLEEIVHLSDLVMVARGDLAIEIGQTRLPSVQKEIIRTCNRMSRPVITATQMLDSMVHNPRPTRAEITDVANAVIDGSDALMLSAESATGQYPFEAIRTMHEIIREVESSVNVYNRISLDKEFLTDSAAIAASATLTALKLDAKVICCLTTSGKTAGLIASFRPRAKLVAVTDEVKVLNSLETIWGLQTLPIGPYQSMREVLTQVEKVLIQYRLAKAGDKVVMSLGLPVEPGVKTNSLHVFTLSGEGLEPLPDVLESFSKANLRFWRDRNRAPSSRIGFAAHRGTLLVERPRC
jgi:pyruvate kinase